MQRMTSRCLSGSASGTVPREMSQRADLADADAAHLVVGRDLAQLGHVAGAHSSIANSQRSLKRQPPGRAPGAGVRPGMPLSARAWLRCGIESSSARV